jgi:uncharacterized protein (DUF1810 family)
VADPAARRRRARRRRGTAEEIFGPVDAMKFRSSMTLFAKVAEENEEFDTALQKYFGGVYDERTQEIV